MDLVGDGANETSVPTDDPSVAGSADLTVINITAVAAPVVQLPVWGGRKKR